MSVLNKSGEDTPKISVYFLSLTKMMNQLEFFGKGTVIIGNKNTKEKNVLLVEDMKHNILSVSQMCDQGHKLMFDS